MSKWKPNLLCILMNFFFCFTFATFLYKLLNKILVTEDYDCWCDLFSDFKKTITSFKLESFAYFVKYTSVDNDAEDLPYDTFTFEKISIWKLLLRCTFSAFCRKYKFRIFFFICSKITFTKHKN